LFLVISPFECVKYSFYSLIIGHINDARLDYNFITKEILCRYDETQRYLTDIRMCELEEFKVANCLYIHPQLGKIMSKEKKSISNDISKSEFQQHFKI